MDERSQYWLSMAEYDMDTAKAMLQTGRYLYVGFMCHQTIEKALKAIIARDCAEGDLPPKIHHLLKLAELSGLFQFMSLDQQSFIKQINPMYIEARYPNYKYAFSSGLNDQQCHEILTRSEELLCWIRQQL